MSLPVGGPRLPGEAGSFLESGAAPCSQEDWHCGRRGSPHFRCKFVQGGSSQRCGADFRAQILRPVICVLLTFLRPAVARFSNCLVAVSVSSASYREGRQPLHFGHVGTAASWQLQPPCQLRLSCESRSRITRSEVCQPALAVGSLSRGFSEARRGLLVASRHRVAQMRTREDGFVDSELCFSTLSLERPKPQ